MGKPSGIHLGMTSRGPVLSVTAISRAQDAIWNAVQEAVDGGMTPEQFRREVVQAWAEELKREKDRVLKVLSA